MAGPQDLGSWLRRISTSDSVPVFTPRRVYLQTRTSLQWLHCLTFFSSLLWYVVHLLICGVANTSQFCMVRGARADDNSTDWQYQGCFHDNIGHGRVMAHGQPANPDMTVESCTAVCASKGYTVAGMEYSTQCFCDNYLRDNTTRAESDSACAMPCIGDSSQICGGPNLLSVYSKGDLKILPVPKVQTKNLPGSWEYKGCLQYVFRATWLLLVKPAMLMLQQGQCQWRKNFPVPDYLQRQQFGNHLSQPLCRIRIRCWGHGVRNAMLYVFVPMTRTPNDPGSLR